MTHRFGLLLVLALLTACQAVPSPAPAPSSPPASSALAGRCLAPSHYLAAGRPDPCLTPGQARTDDPAVLCPAGAARQARAELSAAQWRERRRQVERAYGLTSNPGEIDHALPLEGGGSNALVNLWPEAPPQYQAKDRAEGALHRALCQGWPGRPLQRAEVRRLQAAFLARWAGA